jgi:hypothetical protein
MVDREHFYHLPKLDIKEISKRSSQTKDYDPPLKLKRYEDGKLKRYIDRRIPKDFSDLQVLSIAQKFVLEVCQIPPLNLQTSTDTEIKLSRCITAFLTHVLFWDDGATGMGILNSEFTLYKKHYQGVSREDAFNIGLKEICQPSQFLKNFVPKIDWYDSLLQYTRSRYQNRLIEGLRALNPGFKRTNLGFLKHNGSRKSIREGLVFAGEVGDRLSGLELLYECFIENDIAKIFATDEPQPEHYQLLLKRYRERTRSAGVDFEIIDMEQVRQFLELIANSFRQYKQLKPISLDSKLGDEETISIGELQADPQQTNVLQDWENNSEIRELAVNLLDRHSTEHKLFLLLHGLEMNQEETGLEVDLVPQYKVSREQKRLLATLAKELQKIERQSVSPQSPTAKIIEDYMSYIKSTCEDYYPELLRDILTEIVKSASNDSNIEHLFIDRLETQWQFKFKPDGVGARKAAKFVQRRLNLPSFYPDELPM